ncbi:hypothetical protein ACLUWU_07345 [Bifidobacterium thermophilum]|uniref:hypothetical protein n=1 Tax=Bifidobacterium thermophilum TaxID=33905 RepID=UPI003992EF74
MTTDTTIPSMPRRRGQARLDTQRRLAATTRLADITAIIHAHPGMRLDIDHDRYETRPALADLWTVWSGRFRHLGRIDLDGIQITCRGFYAGGPTRPTEEKDITPADAFREGWPAWDEYAFTLTAGPARLTYRYTDDEVQTLTRHH